MAKHPVPKRRASHTRKALRASANQTSAIKKLAAISETVKCTACGAPRRPHTACPTCGMYRGRQVVAKKVATVEKIQA